LPLPEAWDEGTFVALARDNGVAVAAGSHFAIDDAPAQTGVRVSLGAGSEADLEDGLTVLARLIRTTPERSSPVF
jgi:DNA-binding transcriptional MocR family regulator